MDEEERVVRAFLDRRLPKASQIFRERGAQVCPTCDGVLFPEDTDRHASWHSAIPNNNFEPFSGLCGEIDICYTCGILIPVERKAVHPHYHAEELKR